ncbi:MAG: hypothetical protein M3419_01945 [Actinomycetota bacterium]|nr:hypothetical protein [Actinomycetota bacterium]
MPRLAAPHRELAELSAREQLRAGRTRRRLGQLFLGLLLYGWSMAMMIRSTLGLNPWDVFHDGIVTRTGLSFGTVVILVSVVVLLLWIPLRQWPGLGTLCNAVVVGLAADLGLLVIPAPDALEIRLPLLLVGVVANGLAGALYIGAQFGPGPRDGLMTGLVWRTGRSIRLVRTCLELGVLGIGWALGGLVGVGTVLYALAIGPLVQLFLPYCVVDLPTPTADTANRVSGGWRGRPRSRR